MKSVDDWKALLRVELRAALVARQMQTAAVLRETLAAIDNAEAPPLSAVPSGQASAVFAGGVRGLGAGEVACIRLSPAAVAAIVDREIEERKRVSAEYRTLGQGEAAEVLQRQIEVLVALVTRQDPAP